MPGCFFFVGCHRSRKGETRGENSDGAQEEGGGGAEGGAGSGGGTASKGVTGGKGGEEKEGSARGADAAANVPRHCPKCDGVWETGGAVGGETKEEGGGDAGNADDAIVPHHCPTFDVDERALGIGASVFVQLVDNLLCGGN